VSPWTPIAVAISSAVLPGSHGNPVIQTPTLDRLHGQSVRLTRFYVSPVCSPTRASLMTGRYNYRTGIVDTAYGRSMMHPDETTLAEMLAAAGYRTGIFGKWHLGDNYPLRPIDQGFQDAVVIKGGGLGQPSDFPGGGSYTNPVLLRNGKPERFQGYCTEIYFNQALRFIDENRNRPFFLYLPTNSPHTPLEIADERVARYHGKGIDETTAKIYAMVSEVDGNIGHLLKHLDDTNLAENTVVIFLTDNGPQQKRWNAGMRGLKGTVYEGGIRAPFFVRWPGVVKAGTEVDRLAAHIDLAPTLLDVCGVAPPKNVKLDGRSLAPLLRNPRSDWTDRTIFFQWHRGDVPELYRSCAARCQRWKLVNGKELYDLEQDPAEARDVAADHPEIAAKLKAEYEAWFRDVSSTRGYDPPRIHIGSGKENPVILTRQDWRGPRAGWDPGSLGYWEVFVARPAGYEISVRLQPLSADGKVMAKLNGASLEADVPKGAEEVKLGLMRIPKGEGRLEIEVTAPDGSTRGVHYVTIAG
jgi:arylsulfatase A-like enzyme